MSADGTPGAKGNPQFLGGGAPATATDMNLISTWAADHVGEHYTNEAALPNTNLWNGRLATTDDGTLYRCDGASWVATRPPATFIQYTATGALSFSTSEAKVTGMSTAVATDTSAFTVSSGTYTCVRSGRYRIDAVAGLAASTGAASLRLYVNGVRLIETTGTGSTSGNNTMRVAEVIPFTAADTFELRTIGLPANSGMAGGTVNRITITDA